MVTSTFLLCGSMLWDPRVLIRKTFIWWFWILELIYAKFIPCCACSWCYAILLLMHPFRFLHESYWILWVPREETQKTLRKTLFQSPTQRLHSEFSQLLYLDEKEIPWRTHPRPRYICTDTEEMVSGTQLSYLWNGINMKGLSNIPGHLWLHRCHRITGSTLLSMMVSVDILFFSSLLLPLEYAKCLCHFWDSSKLHYWEETGSNTTQAKICYFHMNALGSQPWWEMKCVEKYRVNKDGFSEMMGLLLPASDSWFVVSLSAQCLCPRMAPAVEILLPILLHRFHLDIGQSVAIYQCFTRRAGTRLPGGEVQQLGV